MTKTKKSTKAAKKGAARPKTERIPAKFPGGPVLYEPPGSAAKCVDLDKGTITNPDGTVGPLFAVDATPEMFPAGDPSKLPHDPNYHAKSNGEHKTTRTQMSAIDAAAQVLREAGTSMDCKTLIAKMQEQKLWTSPGGKTPHATLYSAILREMQNRGAESRFAKATGGFVARSANPSSKPNAPKAEKRAVKRIRRARK